MRGRLISKFYSVRLILTYLWMSKRVLTKSLYKHLQNMMVSIPYEDRFTILNRNFVTFLPHLSVILFTGGRAWRGCVHGRGCEWQGACMAGGMHSRGMCGRGCAWWGACKHIHPPADTTRYGQ